MKTGRCPNADCRGEVDRLVCVLVPIVEGRRETEVGALYLCPHCRTILGAGMDPRPLAEDLCEEIEKVKGRVME